MHETQYSTPRLAAIYLYPIKALDGVAVAEAIIRPSGGLRWDREFLITDADGKKINGKRTPRVHDLRAAYDLTSQTVRLHDTRSADTIVLDLNKTRALEAWLSVFFDEPVTLKRDPDHGFPDDPSRPGPTILSEASIAEVGSWYPDLDQAEIGRRFRANLILTGVPAFWEDGLIGDGEQGVPFRIGDVRFEGVNPCARCVVVTRDPVTGVSTPEFQQIFSARRQETLPDGVDASRFNHYFRLALNTSVPASEVGKTIKVGDEVQVNH